MTCPSLPGLSAPSLPASNLNPVISLDSEVFNLKLAWSVLAMPPRGSDLDVVDVVRRKGDWKSVLMCNNRYSEVW
jgi:hypothetical protein